jgi:hypothetical protein
MHGMKTIPPGCVRAMLTGMTAEGAVRGGASCLGKRVQKEWPDGKVYDGEVKCIDTCDGRNGQEKGALLYHILFNDGDEEDWYEEELMRNLVDNQQAVRQARTAADAMQRLTITLWQGNRAREKLCDKTKRLVQNISSYSEKTRAVRNGETPAAAPASADTIYVWDEATHKNHTSTALN